MVSAFNPNPFHFHTQLSDGSIVVEFYYQGQTTKGFGTFFKFPSQPAEGSVAFGPADKSHPWNTRLGLAGALPFSPYGIHRLTRFATFSDRSPNLGWGNVTQPSGAPVWR